MRQQLRKVSQIVPETKPPTDPRPPAAPAIGAEVVAEGTAKLLRARGEEIAVFKLNGELYGIQNICPHEGGQLCKGTIKSGEVVCPLHRYRFDLKTGACSTDPRLKIKVFQLVNQNDQYTLAPEEDRATSAGQST